uniref:Uncharacterized protein n=1 Tax=Glossina brevipalpis TaxID=37001 RepID=A0A1A9X0T5_9MUSC
MENKSLVNAFRSVFVAISTPMNTLLIISYKCNYLRACLPFYHHTVAFLHPCRYIGHQVSYRHSTIVKVCKIKLEIASTGFVQRQLLYVSQYLATIVYIFQDIVEMIIPSQAIACLLLTAVSSE